MLSASGGRCKLISSLRQFNRIKMCIRDRVILAGRRINDKMGQYVATSIVKQMILKGITIQGSVVTVAGITFKENVPDIRNSKVIDIVRELEDFGIDVQVIDPLANPNDVEKAYGLRVCHDDEIVPADGVVFAVAHRVYVDVYKRQVVNKYEAQLYVAGQGSLTEDLERQAIKLGISDRVVFLGLRRDIPQLLEAADGFVLSSAWEGLPNTVMELSLIHICPSIF